MNAAPLRQRYATRPAGRIGPGMTFEAPGAEVPSAPGLFAGPLEREMHRKRMRLGFGSLLVRTAES